MKTIYLVRHGQTFSNRTYTVQDLHTDILTDAGLSQAEKLAQRAQSLVIDSLVSSDATRAMQTAQAIADVKGLEIEESRLFRERKYPTSLENKKFTSDEYRDYDYNRYHSLDDPEYRFEDAENFYDLQKRAKKAWEFLENHDGENIIVVTHGMFLRYMTMQVIYPNADPKHWYESAKSFKSQNTGLSVFHHTGERWVMLSWNDQSHLGDFQKPSGVF